MHKDILNSKTIEIAKLLYYVNTVKEDKNKQLLLLK